MSDFTGQKIANTYKNLLQVSVANSSLGTALKSVETGAGNVTPLQISTDKVNINGTFQLNGTAISDIATSVAVQTNTDAITSINAVVANVSSLTKTNLDAITSINTVVGNLSVNAITSINTVLTSVNNRTVAVSALTKTN